MKCSWCHSPLDSDHEGPRYCSTLCRDKCRAKAQKQCSKDKEKVNAASLAYYYKEIRTNPERMKARNERGSAWRKKYPERSRLSFARYKARHVGAQGNYTAHDVTNRWAMYGNLCWIPGCGKPAEATDHVIPLAKGGSNWPSNLRPICRSHNSSKQDQMPAQYLSRVEVDAA